MAAEFFHSLSRYCALVCFLAVASIEGTGKAFIAFEGQGRNLSDSGIAPKLKRAMEKHRVARRGGIADSAKCR